MNVSEVDSNGLLSIFFITIYAYLTTMIVQVCVYGHAPPMPSTIRPGRTKKKMQHTSTRANSTAVTLMGSQPPS
jgi:hypothetical protein